MTTLPTAPVAPSDDVPEAVRTSRARGRVAVILNSPYLYGMERAVIELFSALRPEAEPRFLMSHVTVREKLPIYKEVQRRGLLHEFMPDRTPWPRLEKPRSLRHLLRMTLAWLRGSFALAKMGAGRQALYVSSLTAAPYAWPLAAVYRMLGRRVVHHFHDLRQNRFLMRTWAPLVTDFVHNSQHCRDRVLLDHPYLRSKRNHVLPYIMDLAPPEGPAALTPGRRHLVLAGQISPHKGIDLLLEAFVRVAADHPDVTLNLVGSCAAGYDQEFQRRLRAAQTLADVNFWGYTENVLDFFRAAYLHVQPTPPSRFQESFPRAALEAMASGVPTVCFASGGLQDMIQDGITGIVCSEESVEALATALQRFLADPAFRDRCARQAYERYLREYSAAQLRRRWLELLVPQDEEDKEYVS